MALLADIAEGTQCQKDQERRIHIPNPGLRILATCELEKDPWPQDQDQVLSDHTARSGVDPHRSSGRFAEAICNAVRFVSIQGPH